MARARILVVDPDASVGDMLRPVLEGQGYRVETAASAGQAPAGPADWDVILVALDPADPGGTDALSRLGSGGAAPLTIALVPAGAGARGLAARDVGAYAFLEKPTDLTREKVLTIVANALDHRRLRDELDDLRRERAVTAAPPVRRPDAPGTLNLEERERQAILQALESTHWNKQAAAGLLGLHRPTLYSKMRKHGIPQKRPG